MRIKLDENVPVLLAEELRRRGHDVDTVVQEGLQGQSDAAVLQQAIKEKRAVLTQDLHLGDLRRISNPAPPGVVLLRLSDQDPDVMIDRMRQILQAHDLDQWAGCLVVISDRKIRTRKL